MRKLYFVDTNAYYYLICEETDGCKILTDNAERNLQAVTDFSSYLENVAVDESWKPVPGETVKSLTVSCDILAELERE